MKRRKYLFFIFLGVLLVFMFIFYFVFVNRGLQEERLLTDASKYAQQSFMDDREFPFSHVPYGYRMIEENIEDYIQSFYKQYQTVQQYANDEKLKTLLSISNYSEDGTEFSDSISYVEELRSTFDQDMQVLLSFCSSDNLKDYASHLDLSSYYRQLFIKTVMESGILNQLESYKDIFLESENHMNQVFNTTIQVFDFLKSNVNNWKIEGDEIQFSTENLVTQYNSLVSVVQ